MPLCLFTTQYAPLYTHWLIVAALDSCIPSIHHIYIRALDFGANTQPGSVESYGDIARCSARVFISNRRCNSLESHRYSVWTTLNLSSYTSSLGWSGPSPILAYSIHSQHLYRISCGLFSIYPSSVRPITNLLGTG